MIYNRVENIGAGWVDVLYQVLLTYNNKMVHNVTHMTPNDAKNKMVMIWLLKLT